MQVSTEDFNRLLELMEVLKSKVELYEKLENVREKEFRELERDVYRLRTRLEAPSVLDGGVVGQSWLR